MQFQVAKKNDDTYFPLVYGIAVDDDLQQPVTIPTAAVLTILLDDDTQLTIDGTVNINSVTGQVQYLWSVANEAVLTTDLPRFNNRAVWTITISGTDYERVQYFDIREHAIQSFVTDSMIVNRWPLLNDHRFTMRGTATGGTTTYVEDTSNQSKESPNRWEGSILEMLSGSNAREQRLIDSSDPITGQVVVTIALPYAVDVGATYEIHSAWTLLISDAYRQMHNRVKQWLKNTKWSLLVDSGDFDEPHIQLSAALIAESLTRREDDEYSLLADDRRRDYEATMNTLDAKFQISDEGSLGTGPIGGVRWAR